MKLYGYEKCSTCRNAVRLLKSLDIEYEWVPVRETPPNRQTLKQVHKLSELPMRKLFNTSGREYRFLGLKDKLHLMTDGQKIDLLAGNGNLVKRPILIGDGIALVGFNETEWREALRDV